VTDETAEIPDRGSDSGSIAGEGASRAHAAYLGTTHFRSLDGLRFLAIAAVLWHHAPVYGAMADPPRLLERGFVGVDLFFVLSGYLITTLLLREAARDGRFSLAGFYRRRAIRILPVYFVVVTAMGLWFVVVRGQTEYAPLWPFYYLFLSNFLVADIPNLGPTWSLSVEEQYYLIWPLLLLLLPRRAVLPALAVLVAVNVAGAAGLLAPLGIVPVEAGVLRLALPNATYAPILMGSAVALLLDRPDGFAAFWRWLGHRMAAPLCLAVVVVLVAVLPEDLRGWPNFVMHLAMCAFVAALVIREDNALAGALSARPVARVGEISYGIYLYHLIALDIVLRLPGLAGVAAAPTWWPWAVLVLYTALSLVIAEISFRTLEAWFRRFRTKPRKRVGQGEG